MIEPSSSEEDEDEVVDAPPQGPPRGQNQVKVPNGNAKATPADGTTSGGNADLKIEKVTSPTSSQNSEKNLTEAELRVSRILQSHISDFKSHPYVQLLGGKKALIYSEIYAKTSNFVLRTP